MYLGTKVSVFLGEYGREWQDVFILRGQRPGGAPGTLVVVHASKWIVYDNGRLAAGAEELRKETGRRKEPEGSLPKKLMAAVPKRPKTPFAYDDYGRPLMDDAAEQWFQEACRKRCHFVAISTSIWDRLGSVFGGQDGSEIHRKRDISMPRCIPILTSFFH